MTRARDLAAGTFEQATGGVLKLETSDTTVTDGSVLGKIEFKAPDEASGTDAILVGAAIEAVAEGTFAADNNATELVFKTGASAAADAKMTLTSGGNLGIGTSSPNFTLQLDSQRADATFDANNLDTWADFKIQGQTSSGNARGIYFDFDNDTGNDKGAGIVGISGDGTGGVGSLGFITTAGNSSAERMRITSSGSVGIGTSSPQRIIHTKSSVPAIRLEDSDVSGLYHEIVGTASGPVQFKVDAGNVQASSALSFVMDGSEAMRLDASGNLLVGHTLSDVDTLVDNNYVGIALKPNGEILASSLVAAATLERENSNGDIIEFRKDGTTVGSIGFVSTGAYIQGETDHSGFRLGGSQIVPFRNGADTDNTTDLGASGTRFDDIFATNGTIQTSDRNEKQDIASLTSAEMLVAKRISALFKTFRWKDKVAEKGANARTHTGIIAQDVQAAFTAEGLDAGDYSLFISSTWWEHNVDVPAVEAADAVYEDVVIAAVEEELDEEGNVLVEAQEERTEQRLITEAVEAKDAYTRTDTYDTQSEAPEGATSKTRMGIRYPELLSFVAAYNEQRFADIETRLTALEG